MDCLKPTIINVFQMNGINIVKRIYNVPYNECIAQQKTPGKYYYVYLSTKDKERLHTDTKTEYMKCTFSSQIPCGQCEYCSSREARHLANRIQLETLNKEAYFITLTYNEQNNPKTLRKEDAQDFILKLKKDAPELRYIIVGEYGSKTGRPHLHAIIWNTKGMKIHKEYVRNSGKDHANILFTSKYWRKGDTTIATADEMSIYYTCQYCQKKLIRTREEKEEMKKAGINPEFRLMSRGIAYNYYEEHEQEIDNHTGKITLPHGMTMQVDRSYIKWKAKNGKPKPSYMENITNTINLREEYPIKAEKGEHRKHEI